MNPPGLSILVVDADESFRRSLAEFFEDRGWRSLSVPGCAAAISELRRIRYDAVIVDPRLADGSIETFTRMAMDSANPPVLAICTGSNDPAMNEYLSGIPGINGGIVSKPVMDMPALERTLRDRVEHIGEPAPDPLAQQRRILVVEDESVLRLGLVEFLEDHGFEALSASNGLEGLEVLRSSHPDLVIADLRMPLMGGHEFLRQAGDSLRELPILVVSGTGEIADVVLAMHLGAWDYILKPVMDMSVFTIAMDKAFEKAELVRQNRMHLQDLERRVEERTRSLSMANSSLMLLNEDLRLSQERNRILLDNLPTQVWYLADPGTYGVVNRVHAEFFGMQADQMAFRRIEDVLGNADPANSLSKNDDVFSGTGPVDTETWLRDAEGRRRLVAIHKCPVLDVEGKVKYVVCSGEDLTEARASQEQTRQLQEQMLHLQKMESLGRLAGGVAHDFNNLLGVILGHCELALLSEEIPRPVRESLDLIMKTGKRSAALTKQLLSFARREPATKETVDLNERISETLSMLRRLVGEDITLEWKPFPGLWKTLVDPSQMDQILANLCVNAKDAICGRGTITIGTENAIAGTAPDTMERVRLVVSDNGCGMDQQTLERIFEPFFTTKPVGSGTGLGLSTVFGIVNQNGGSIDVRSRIGQGTTFQLDFPRWEGANVPSCQPSKPSIVDRKLTVVLLVEDEPDLLNLLKSMLERIRCNVVSATDAMTAIRIVETHKDPIHLLLTDIVMPGTNGLELAGRIRRLRPGIRTLYMSGYTSDVLHSRGVVEEQVDLIRKPFDLEELANRIDRLMATSSDERLESPPMPD